MHEDFNREAKEYALKIEKSIYDNYLLFDSLDSFYAASERIRRDEFRAFVRPLLEHYFGIVTIEWIPRVPLSERSAYEKAAQEDGFRDFKITERQDDGRMVRAEQRQEYFPVHYVEPYEGNELAIGFDAASEPRRLEALARARDSGETTATGRIRLIQKTPSQYGVEVFRPVYSKAAPHSDGEQRKNLEGFFAGALDVGKIVETTLEYLNPKVLDVCVWDRSARDDERVLYFHSSPSRSRPISSASQNKVSAQTGIGFYRSIRVAARDWMIQVLPTPQFIASAQTWRGPAVLMGGLVLIFSLGVYMELVRRGVRRAHEYASAQAAARNELGHEIAERERVEEALRKEEKRYRTLAQNIPGMVYRGKTDWSAEVFSNSEAVCGYTIEDFNSRSLSWLDIIHPDDKVRVVTEALELETVRRDDIVQEYRIIDKRGGTRWVEDHKSPQFTEEGVFAGIDGIVFDITQRKRGEDRLVKVNETLLSLGSDFGENINRLTGLCGELLGASCALYNRLEGDMLCSLGQWQCPPDHNPVDKADGHICNDVIRRARSEVVVIRNLSKTSYASTDPCVLRYNLESYTGIAVKCGDEFVGALCAVYRSDIEPTEEDKRIMGIVASAIGQEEQRRRAEEAVLSNLRFLEIFLDTIPSPVFYKDAEGIYQGCNKAFAKNIIGLKRQEIIGKSVYDMPDVIPRELADIYHQADMKLISEPGIAVHEAQVRCADAKVHDFVFNKATFSDAGGRVKGLVGIMLDITERKRANEALRESEEKWRSLVENAPDIILTVDRQGKILFINRVMPNISTTVAETVGTSIYDYTSDHEHDKIRAALEEVFKSGHIMSYETSVVQPGDAGSWYSARAAPIKHNGEIIAATLVCTDITERKQMEQALQKAHDELEVRVEQRTSELARANEELLNEIAEREQTEESLRESEQRYRAIFEQAGDSIVLFDADNGEMVDFNDKTCRTLGYTREEFRQLRIPDFEVEESAEQSAAHVRKIVERGSDIFETRHRRKDGRILNILVSTRVISIGGRTYIQAIWRDITDRKKAEEKLMAYQQQLRSLASELSLSEERLRRRIATDVHDNIGQNLAISKIKLESLVKSASSAELAKGLGQVSELIGRMIESTRSLTFELSPPVLYELGFEAAVEWLVRNMRKQHGLSTEFVNDRRPKPLDEAAMVFLFQAVRELLVNIAKHARADNVIVSTERVGDEVHVSVEDDGVGFDLLHARQIGWQNGGFGLFSIRERLGHIGGHLSIESKPGHGTLATLIVPIDRKAQKTGEKRK